MRACVISPPEETSEPPPRWLSPAGRGAMSRLDSFIRRLIAQRDCLAWAAREIKEIPGPILEMGLGNGRTYDHLRELCPGREIYVFEREVRAHPDCIPEPERLFLGDIVKTLPVAIARLGRTAALIHSDIGTGDAARNAQLAAKIAPLYRRLARPGGIVLSDQALPLAGWEALDTPVGVAASRYFIYRAGENGC